MTAYYCNYMDFRKAFDGDRKFKKIKKENE